MARPESALRILVVDDDAGVRKLLVDLFTHDGHDVEQVDAAEAAVERLLRHRYSLLVTDFRMPGLSGLGLIQEVRARGLEVPVLLFSGEIDPILERAVREYRRVECLTKPFHLDAARAAVERLMASKDSRHPESTR